MSYKTAENQTNTSAMWVTVRQITTMYGSLCLKILEFKYLIFIAKMKLHCIATMKIKLNVKLPLYFHIQIGRQYTT